MYHWKNYIAIFIISVFSFFAIMQTYKRCVLSTMFTTGHVLCNEILNAELHYYQKNKHFKYTERTTFDEELGIDVRNHQFFSSFSVYTTKNDKSVIKIFGTGELENYDLFLEFDDNSTGIQDPKKLRIKVLKRKNLSV